MKSLTVRHLLSLSFFKFFSPKLKRICPFFLNFKKGNGVKTHRCFRMEIENKFSSISFGNSKIFGTRRRRNLYHLELFFSYQYQKEQAKKKIFFIDNVLDLNWKNIQILWIHIISLVYVVKQISDNNS